MSINTDGIMSLYKERERLIIIGLTGRTGAGCTTVSEILSRKSIKDLDLKSYKTCDYSSADERKYSIIYRFMKEGKKWKPFTVIEASTVLFSFIIESDFKTLCSFITTLSADGVINGLDELKNKLKDHFNISDDNDVISDRILGHDEIKALKDLKKNTHDLTKEEVENIINVYTCILNDKKDEFKELLQYYSIVKEPEKDKAKEIYNLYTYFMQISGNNIRSSGSYNDSQRNAGNEVTLALRINQILNCIDYLEGLNHPNEEKTRVCIDALRNSMEIQYFRDKYRSFYTIAVNTEDLYRVRRIGTNRKEIESLDKIEYPDNDEGYFFHQNIEACIQLADIYLYNPDVYNNKYFELSEQIIKYIALMIHPGLVTPTHVERCMQLAFNAKYNSGCLSRQVGAIVTGDDFSVRSVGWNDVPKGQVPCNLRCVEDYCRNKDSESFSNFELSDALFDEAMQCINSSLQEPGIEKKGQLYAFCFKDIYNGIKNSNNQVHTRALHAEENAFLQIAKFGGAKVEGGKLFSTASPCELCSKKAYQLGIKEIYYIDPYPGISKSHILSFGSTGNPKMILFKGAIGNAYISLYSPKIPYKDEIKLVTGVHAKKIANEVYKMHKDDN